MRVAYLIAGAGGMYCGSCMRDNRIAATLIERGHDVILMPLYTPVRTDETDVSQLPVHYGGISIYLSQKSGLFRRLPAFVKRWLDAPALLRLVSRWAVKTDGGDLGDLTVAMLNVESPIHAEHLDQLIRDLRQLEPQIIHLPNLMFAAVAAPLKQALQVPVVCTMAGEDVFLDELPHEHSVRAAELIRSAAGDVDGFITPTRYYGQAMVRRFGVDDSRVHHVPMGIHCAELSGDRPAEQPFVIGSLARVAPEKGLAELADAFILLCQDGHDCILRAAGYMAASQQPYLDGIRNKIRQAGLGERFEYRGELNRDAKLTFLRSLHCLAVPTPYPEAKGFYVLEAMMCGVPVVLPRRGSFPEHIEATGGGVLHEPDSAEHLAAAIAGLMKDPQQRAALGARGREVVCAEFHADAMADAAWDVFRRYARV